MTIAASKPHEKQTLFDKVDDWTRREGFLFVGWSGLLLLPTAYFALGGIRDFKKFSDSILDRYWYIRLTLT